MVVQPGWCYPRYHYPYGLWHPPYVVENGIMIQQPMASCIDAFSHYVRWSPRALLLWWMMHGAIDCPTDSLIHRSIITQQCASG